RLAHPARDWHRAPDGDLRSAHRADRPAGLWRRGRAGALRAVARLVALAALGLWPGPGSGPRLRLAGRLRGAGAARLHHARPGAALAPALSPAGHLDAAAGRA